MLDHKPPNGEPEPLRLFDGHVHVVSTDALTYPRRGPVLANGAWWEDGDFSVDAFQENASVAAVEGAVLVQATGTYGTDNSYLVGVLAQQRQRFVGVAVIDPTTEHALTQLAQLLDRGITGIRLFHIPTPAPPWLDTPAADRLVDAAAVAGCAISICVQHHDLALVEHQVARRPDVAFALDHCGLPEVSDGPPFTAAATLWQLSEHENLLVKFSPTLAAMAAMAPASAGSAGSATTGQHAASDDMAHTAPALLETVVERFGADRVMLGSDWPQHREPRHFSYAQQVDRLIGWTTPWSESSRRAMLSGNTRRFFGLPADGAQSVPT